MGRYNNNFGKINISSRLTDKFMEIYATIGLSEQKMSSIIFKVLLTNEFY